MGNQQNNLKYIEDEFRKNSITLSLNSMQLNEIEIKFISQIISKSTSLLNLLINNTNLGDSGLSLLTEPFKSNSHLKGIYLESNKITEIGAYNLATALKINKSIEKIELLDNSIGDNGVKSLCISLTFNNTLQKLGLSDNHITDQSMNYIVTTLEKNTSINTLSLYGNKITDEGIKKLCEGLKLNNSLKKIFLGRNEITNIGANLLLEILNMNCSLIEIGLSDNPITNKTIINDINNLLKKVRQIKNTETHTIENSKIENPSLPIEILKIYEDDDETPILKYKINLSDIKFKTSPIKGDIVKVGSGGFGMVYLAEYKGKFVAVKISKGHLILQEMKLVFTLNHPNIHSPICYAKEDDTYYMISKYFQGGDLRDILGGNEEKITIKRKIYIIYQVSNAIMYLHERDPPILHRDIKSNNVLIGYDFNDICLTDFGTAIFTYKDFKLLTDVAGTPNYMSPELFKDQEYDISSDVYSFGMLLYEIFSDRIPFNGLETAAIKRELMNGKRPDMNLVQQKDTPKEIIDLIVRCWDEKPLKRPNIKEVNEILKRLSSI
jgi:hypothetical protein